MQANICCFTGHREIPFTELPSLKRKLSRAIAHCIRQGCTEFRCGGALGFDTLAARAVLSARKKHPHIRLVLMLPCPEQTKGWSAANIKTYGNILQKADAVIYTADHYYRGCMHLRNRRLVDSSSFCIAYCRRDTGGSAYTVQYAKKQGCSVIPL